MLEIWKSIFTGSTITNFKHNRWFTSWNIVYKYYYIKVLAYDNNINDVKYIILHYNDESNHNDFEKRSPTTIII